MPMYEYKCYMSHCGHADLEYLKMADGHQVVNCPKCKFHSYAKQVSRVHTDLKEFSTPIVMHSIGCTDMGQIREMQKAGVSISDDPRDENFGVPIAHSRHEKLKALKVAKFQEAN